jgi:hypothetical protein
MGNFPQHLVDVCAFGDEMLASVTGTLVALLLPRGDKFGLL